jgi:hypothetical protein
VSTCKTCGAAIVWARTIPGGKQMPVDPEPADYGNVELYTMPSGKYLARVVKGNHQSIPGRRWHLSHFASCPDANLHRRTRTASETSNPLMGWE